MRPRAEPLRREGRARPPRGSSEAGFTVLEAIVAVAILGLAMVPLLALQVQTSQGAIALQRSVDTQLARDTALAYLRLVDSSVHPDGEQDIGGGWKMRWKTEVLGPERPAIAGQVESGRFAVTRARMVADVVHESGRTVTVSAFVAGIRETAPYQILGQQ